MIPKKINLKRNLGIHGSCDERMGEFIVAAISRPASVLPDRVPSKHSHIAR